MIDCVFCKILQGDIPSHVVYENDQVRAFLDIQPVNVGHTLIIPKTHYASFAETPAEIVHALTDAAQQIAPGILKAVRADAFNFSTNNGRAAGQIVFHTHMHLIPRFPADGHEMWHGSDVHQDLAAVAKTIRDSISA